MKLACKVIGDMLPMYHDQVCSEETAALVEKHLQGCPKCRQVLSDLRGELTAADTVVDDIKPLKKIQKRYKKLRLGWLIAVFCLLVLVPAAFFAGNKGGKPVVEYSPKEAIADANAFMTCLAEKDYAKAYTYWNIEEEKRDLLSGKILTEEDLANFEADGLKKFCEGGEKLEAWGGITDVQFVKISDASYNNRYGTEEYIVSYTVRFNGNEEGFSVNLTKDGINHLNSGDSLIRHPLSHLTLWVQWVVDDYQGRYYDFDSGKWVQLEQEN